MLPPSLFRLIKRYSGLGGVGKVVGPLLTTNLVGGVSVYLNLVSGKDRLDIGGVGICLNSVSSKNG